MPRFFDYPDHRFYGPARRCWVIFAGLFPDLDLLDIRYKQEWYQAWDLELVNELAAGATEFEALQTIVVRALDCYHAS